MSHKTACVSNHWFFYLILLDFPSFFCLLEYVIRIYMFPIASKRQIQIAWLFHLVSFKIFVCNKIEYVLISVERQYQLRNSHLWYYPGRWKVYLRLYILQNNNCALETKQILWFRYFRILFYCIHYYLLLILCHWYFYDRIQVFNNSRFTLCFHKYLYVLLVIPKWKSSLVL